jgi:hypothetical protein
MLVFDLFLGLMQDSTLKPAGVVSVGEWEYRRFVGSRVLPARQIEVTLVFEVHRSGVLQECIKEYSWVAITHRKELHELLAESGIRALGEFSDYQFIPFQAGDDLLVIEAIRE